MLEACLNYFINNLLTVHTSVVKTFKGLWTVSLWRGSGLIEVNKPSFEMEKIKNLNKDFIYQRKTSLSLNLIDFGF